jgi:hypothetical protein
MDVGDYLQGMLENELPSSKLIADSLLNHALTLDQNRPVDDISVVVVQVLHHSGDDVRRMMVRLPL